MSHPQGGPFLGPAASDLPILVAAQARQLFESRRYLCAEAVLVAMNRTFAGGLDEGAAAGLASALPDGVGGAGCLCGAVSGGLLGLGLLLGNGAGFGPKLIRSAGRELHDAFKVAAGSTCCKVLRRKVKERSAHFEQCAGLTALAAELATRAVLSRRPELALVDRTGLGRRQPAWWTQVARLKRNLLG